MAKRRFRCPGIGMASLSPRLSRSGNANTNELEDKIIGMYAKGLSVRDIQDTLEELYGVEVSSGTISAITDKVWSLVEAWQSRPLTSDLRRCIYLDAIHINLRREWQSRKYGHVYRAGGRFGGSSGRFGTLGRPWCRKSANFWLSGRSPICKVAV